MPVRNKHRGTPGVSSIDLSSALETKDKIVAITGVIDKKNIRLQEGVLHATASAHRHANEVTDIVMTMPFQDVSRQRLEKNLAAIN